MLTYPIDVVRTQFAAQGVPPVCRTFGASYILRGRGIDEWIDGWMHGWIFVFVNVCNLFIMQIFFKGVYTYAFL